MASNIFVCKWKKTDSHWQVWVKGRPKLCGQGKTIEKAQEQLEKAIWDSAKELDDVIPTVMEFDPPLPVNERMRKYFTPPICKVYGDGRFGLLKGYFPRGISDEASIDYINSLYEKGVCKTCEHGIGKRTDVILKSEQWEGDYDGLWLFHNQFNFKAYLFSDRFISLLTQQELAGLEFRECQLKRKGKRKYYELRGNSVAHNVSVKGFDADGGECPECGDRLFYIDEPDLNYPMQKFLCRADLPNPIPSCFAATLNGAVTLCMTEERYGQILGDKKIKGITSELIGVIDEELCDRHPRLCVGSAECQMCSKWPETEMQSYWELPANIKDLDKHPLLSWLRNEIKNPELITIVRQEDTLDHIIEIAESGAKIKESKAISFRCPNCWRLGRVYITYNRFKIAW